MAEHNILNKLDPAPASTDFFDITEVPPVVNSWDPKTMVKQVWMLEQRVDKLLDAARKQGNMLNSLAITIAQLQAVIATLQAPPPVTKTTTKKKTTKKTTKKGASKNESPPQSASTDSDTGSGSNASEDDNS